MKEYESSNKLQTINLKIKQLFHEQVSNWELARVNFAGLQTVKSKSFSFGDFEVKVQFNPARITSSGAKTDTKSIAARPCFLCAANRPQQQAAVDYGNYEILVNPFPIFPEHFTIPRKEHVAQQILPYFADMLQLAVAMDDYLVFYNGPKCGASAPDHMHFQAGSKDFLPLVNDYKRLKDTRTDLLSDNGKTQVYRLKNYLRTVYVIESVDPESAKLTFESLTLTLSKGEKIEPMLNIVCTYENDHWTVFVIPRKAFRPLQYTAPENEQLLISPATVEMCGVLITPVEAHFERITKNDIESIFEQVSI